MDRVGRQGVVTMEESRTAEDNLYVVEGMQFDRGYISPYFVTDPERMVRAAPSALHCCQPRCQSAVLCREAGHESSQAAAAGPKAQGVIQRTF